MPSEKKSFADSQEAAFRRQLRAAVRDADMTPKMRAVVMAVLNHWLHHKSKKQPIHPGRDKIAKATGSSVKTVSRTYDAMRDAGILTPVSNLNGGGWRSTRYDFDANALLVMCGKTWLGDFLSGVGNRDFNRDIFGQKRVVNVPVEAGQNVPRYITTFEDAFSRQTDIQPNVENHQTEAHSAVVASPIQKDETQSSGKGNTTQARGDE